MATLYIEEYVDLPRGGDGLAVPSVGILSAKQTAAIGAASTQSAAVGGGVRFIMLTADVACQIEMGSNPTATAASRYLPADTPRPYHIFGGHKIAVIEQQ